MGYCHYVRYSDSCKTGFRPYDLAVQCVLLIAKHHIHDSHSGLVRRKRLALERRPPALLRASGQTRSIRWW
jgi:hypothetical protein